MHDKNRSGHICQQQKLKIFQAKVEEEEKNEDGSVMGWNHPDGGEQSTRFTLSCWNLELGTSPP
jgi:hypothetical protein